MSNRSNPYWISGKAGSGVGGPHNGAPWVWPMSITTRAYTSTSDDEISDQLQLLVNSSACTGFIHESFNKSNVMNYTRPWFAWANSQFADLVLKLAEERPHLIFKS
jgi:meiotically up-regulated gene 157 (Mug157) protein